MFIAQDAIIPRHIIVIQRNLRRTDLFRDKLAIAFNKINFSKLLKIDCYLFIFNSPST